MNTATYPSIQPVPVPSGTVEILPSLHSGPMVLLAIALPVLALLWQGQVTGMLGASGPSTLVGAVAPLDPTPADAPRPIEPAVATEAIPLPEPPPAEELEAISLSPCPEGWDDLGDFRLTAYVLAQEEDFTDSESVDGVCGLEGRWPRDFLFGQGVKMQGSGRAADGRIVHYRGSGCFEVLDCARTASGRCAKAGRTVAVDRTVVPLGSTVWIEGLGIRRAEDTGGGIRGRHIDVYRGTQVGMAQAQGLTRAGRVCVQPEATQG